MDDGDNDKKVEKKGFKKRVLNDKKTKKIDFDMDWLFLSYLIFKHIVLDMYIIYFNIYLYIQMIIISKSWKV